MPTDRIHGPLTGQPRPTPLRRRAGLAVASSVGCRRRRDRGRRSESDPRAPAGDPTAPVYVISATGIVDNVMAGYIEESVRRAARTMPRPRSSSRSTRRVAASTPRSGSCPPPRGAAADDRVGRAERRTCRQRRHVHHARRNLAYMAPGTNIGAASPVGAGGEELRHDRRQGPQRCDRQHPVDRRGARPGRRLGGVDRRGRRLVAGVGGRRRRRGRRHRDLARGRPSPGRRPGGRRRGAAGHGRHRRRPVRRPRR